MDSQLFLFLVRINRLRMFDINKDFMKAQMMITKSYAARNLVNEYLRTVGTTGIACGEHIRLIEPSGSLAMFDEAGINSLMKEAIHPLG